MEAPKGDTLTPMDVDKPLHSLVVNEITVARRYGLSATSLSKTIERSPHQSAQGSAAGLEAVFVLDTNILLTQLKSVMELREAVKPFNFSLLIPWIVIEELDGLKKSTKGLGDSGETSSLTIGYLARCATKFIYDSLQRSDPGLRGQTAFEMVNKSQQVNDDRILDCCLYFSRFTRVLLISNDRNLCVKALVHKIFCFTWEDLPKDRSLITLLFSREKPDPMDAFSEPAPSSPAKIDNPAPHPQPHPSPQMVVGREIKKPKTPRSSLDGAQASNSSPRVSNKRERTPESPAREVVEDSRKKSKVQMPGSHRKRDPSPEPAPAPVLSSTQLKTAISTFEKSWENIAEPRQLVASLLSLLLEILAPVLEEDMKEAFGGLWREAIIKAPPWSRTDIFHILKKHWRVIYGRDYPKRVEVSVQDAFNFVRTYQERRGADPTDPETLRFIQNCEDILCISPDALAGLQPCLAELKGFFT